MSSKLIEPEKIGTFSRRHFLKIVSLEVGMLALGGCKTAGATRALIEMTRSPSAIPPVNPPPDQPTPISTNIQVATPLPQPTTVPDLAYLPEIREVREIYPLPPPRQSEGMPLMNALAQRRSTRSFLPDELPVGILSDMLWAGFGVNRPESGFRTAPSARNMQDIHIYVACTRGLWLFEAQQHSLTAILADDVRPLTQPPTGDSIDAPVQLIYVSRYPDGLTEAEMIPWSWAHSGFISQNVYLYCAAMDMATVVRSAISRPPLAKRIGLRDDEHITLVQSVGLRG